MQPDWLSDFSIEPKAAEAVSPSAPPFCRAPALAVPGGCPPALAVPSTHWAGALPNDRILGIPEKVLSRTWTSRSYWRLSHRRSIRNQAKLRLQRSGNCATLHDLVGQHSRLCAVVANALRGAANLSSWVGSGECIFLPPSSKVNDAADHTRYLTHLLAVGSTR